MLVASLLEAISLTPAIVLVPKHAFVGWQVDKDEKSAWNYLETTLIDSGDFQQAVDYAVGWLVTYENSGKPPPRAIRRGSAVCPCAICARQTAFGPWNNERF
ncbi:MAG: hypothetical protein R2838_18930 [Caldilineaceae bacterium]